MKTVDLGTQVKELREAQREQSKVLTTLTKSLDTLTEKLSKMPADGGVMVNRSLMNGPPAVRTGEDPMTSRGLSFMKMLGVITGVVPRDQAKVELDIHRRLHNAFTPGQEGYLYSGHVGGEKAFLMPLASSFMQEGPTDIRFRREVKQLTAAGCDGADMDEYRWLLQKRWKAAGYNVKTLSWLNEFSGGSLVAPPEMGELIELLRNKEALVNAGARVVPLPPQGRMKYPRQTMASLTFWVGENSPITASDVGTGEITLQAKKLCVLIKAPNELLRFASPAAEALIRDDMTKSLALGLDLAGLEGSGGDNRPLGVIQRIGGIQGGINVVTSGQPGANGDRLLPQDVYRMIAAVEESNAEFEGWVMRPKTLYKYYQLRADAVAQGDSAGMFLFNLLRDQGDGAEETKLGGYTVTKSTQVSQVRTKGTNSGLTYILGGMFSDILIGMFGAIEFSATTLGDTAFINDQTWVKGILSADINVRHEAALVLMDNIDLSQ